MSTLFWHRSDESSRKEVSDEHPLPVYTPPFFATPSFHGAPYVADYIWRLAADGRLFLASDADQNDMVTGQTSFANTTPTWIIRVPAGTMCLPLFMNLSQSSATPGGAAIDVVIEIDDVDRYASGGTAETVFNPSLSRKRGPACSIYSGATASAGYGVRIWGSTIGPDVSPAEGAVQGPYWRPEVPYFLEGPASFLVYTYAGTTGPTWLWTFGWAEFPPIPLTL